MFSYSGHATAICLWRSLGISLAGGLRARQAVPMLYPSVRIVSSAAAALPCPDHQTDWRTFPSLLSAATANDGVQNERDYTAGRAIGG